MLAPAGRRVLAEAPVVMLRASLEMGIGYVAGYPGAPTASVLDVLRRYSRLLDEYGVYFESSTNESAAASKLVISAFSSVRGMVNWKVVGNHVAADVMAHVAAMGVKGGAVVLVGEDVGTDATTIEVRTEYFAHGLGLPVLDPPALLADFYRVAKHAYKLSEFSGSPVYLLFRTMLANSIGSVVYESEPRRPPVNVREKIRDFEPDPRLVAVPPRSREMNAEKYSRRLARASEYARKEKLNIFVRGSRTSSIGFITHGSVFNSLLSALGEYGLAAPASESDFDILSLVLSYPPSPDDVADFAKDKRVVYVVEQGAPPIIEDYIRKIIAERVGSDVRVVGKKDPSLGVKGPVPTTGELTVDRLVPVLGEILRGEDFRDYVSLSRIEEVLARSKRLGQRARAAALLVAPRTPTFCPGCPERPFFTLAKLLDEAYGRSIYAGDIGCYSLSYFEPFRMYDSVTGMGSSLDVASGLSRIYARRVVAMMGDGTFYHKGVANVDNFVHNRGLGEKLPVIFVLFENYWTAMTGHQENPATLAGSGKAVNMAGRTVARLSAEEVLEAHRLGKPLVLDPYDLRRALAVLHEAYRGKKVQPLVYRGECALARQRRERLESVGKTRKYMQVHPELCKGCFACERYIGCPATGLARSPAGSYMVRTIDPAACTGCGVCGITALYALCPATYEVEEALKPSLASKALRAVMGAVALVLGRR